MSIVLKNWFGNQYLKSEIRKHLLDVFLPYFLFWKDMENRQFSLMTLHYCKYWNILFSIFMRRSIILFLHVSDPRQRHQFWSVVAYGSTTSFKKCSLGKATIEYRLTRTRDRFSNIKINKKNCKLWGVFGFKLEKKIKNKQL
jgi:hypothetical protein